MILMGVFMLLAPFQPQPHLMQKLDWLINGLPLKAIDVFDVFWHLLPLMLLVMKYFLAKRLKKQ